MLYVQLDTNWVNNDKIIDAGYDGRGLHATVLCLAKGMDSDGWVSRKVLTTLHAAPDELVERLLALRLLEGDERRVRPWGWHDVNLSSDQIKRRKAEASRRANHSRWHDGPLDGCERCKPEIPCSSDTESAFSAPDSTERVRPGSAADPTASLESEGEPHQRTDPARSPEDRTGRIREVCRAVAEERAEARDDIGPGWIPAVAAALAKDHHDLLHKALTTNPTATIEELADLIESASKPQKSEPANTSAFIKPVAEVLAERPAIDRDLNLGELNKLRGSLAPSGNGHGHA